VDILQRSGDTAAASDTALRAAARFPGDTATVGEAAAVLLANGRCAEARTLLNQAHAPLRVSQAAELRARAERCRAPTR
jgi:hypothetical protein